jgi:hypothetical protein
MLVSMLMGLVGRIRRCWVREHWPPLAPIGAQSFCPGMSAVRLYMLCSLRVQSDLLVDSLALKWRLKVLLQHLRRLRIWRVLRRVLPTDTSLVLFLETLYFKSFMCVRYFSVFFNTPAFD